MLGDAFESSRNIHQWPLGGRDMPRGQRTVAVRLAAKGLDWARVRPSCVTQPLPQPDRGVSSSCLCAVLNVFTETSSYVAPQLYRMAAPCHYLSRMIIL